MITIGALCAGYGGLELGILLAAHRLGIRARVAWQIDNNAYACRILRARGLAGKVIEADMEEVDYASLAKVDILCAGLPCQPWSSAGSQKGAADERNLFPTFFAIADILQPRACLLENSANLPNVDDGRSFRLIMGEIAARWQRSEWGRVSAASVGAPHVRNRLWIIADTDRYRRPPETDAAIREAASNLERHAALCEWRGRAVVPAAGRDAESVSCDCIDVERRAGQALPGWARSAALDYATQRTVREGRVGQSQLRRADDGVASRLDRHQFPRGLFDTSHDTTARVTTRKPRDWAARMHAIGNGVVPQAAAIPAAALLKHMGGQS